MTFTTQALAHGNHMTDANSTNTHKIKSVALSVWPGGLYV